MIALCAFLFCAAPEANPVVAPPFVIVAPWYEASGPSLGGLQRCHMTPLAMPGMLMGEVGYCETTDVEGGDFAWGVR